MSTSRLALFLAVLFSACGSEGPSGSGGSGGGSGGSGGGSGGSGGGSGGSGGSGGGGGITLTMTPFTVNPGQELFKCQFFKNPFGADVDIKTFENHMAAGSHHMFLFLSTNNADAPLQDCANGGFEFHPYVFTTQSRDSGLTYPDTVGMAIPGNQGLEIDAHYINTTQQPITATVQTTLYVAPNGSVTQHAGVIFMNNVGISVPPGGGETSHSASCTLPFQANVLFVGSHMHSRGTDFLAVEGGNTLYHTTDWAEPPPMVFSPPMQIASGTNVQWTCKYTNETNQTLMFGESAATDVMCILTGQYYPVPTGRNPTYTCMAFGN
jgi:hypothetical protein